MKVQNKINLFMFTMLVLLGIPIVISGYIIIGQITYELSENTFIREIQHIDSEMAVAYENHEVNYRLLPEGFTVSVPKKFLERLRSYKFGDTGHLYIIDAKSRVILHKNHHFGEAFPLPFVQEMLQRKQGSIEYIYQGQSYFCVFLTSPSWNWLIALEITEDELFAHRRHYLKLASVFSVLIFLCVLLLSSSLTRRLASQLSTTLYFLRQVADNHLEARIPKVGNDEIGIIQAEINSIIAKIAKTKRAMTEEIQQRELITDELRNQRTLLRLIIDSVPQHIFWKDINSVFLGCNQRYANLVGMTSPEEVVSKTDFDLPWKHEEAMLFRTIDRQVMGSNVPQYHMVQIMRLPEGKQAWIDINKVPLRNAMGKVIGILGTFEDITQRKQFELDLQKNTMDLEQVNLKLKQFKTTLDMTLDSVFMMDVQTLRFFYVNQGAVNHVGYTEQELLQMTLFDIDAECVVAGNYEGIVPQSILPVMSYETTHRHKSSILIPVEVSLQYIQISSQEKRFVAIVRDITERKRMEEQLHQSKDALEILLAERTAELKEKQKLIEEQQKFTSLVENSSDFIAMATLEGKGMYVNEAGRTLVGLDSLENVRQTRMQDYLTEETKELWLKEAIPMVLKYTRWEGESRFRHFKTGKIIDVQSHLFLVKHPLNNKPICFATVTRDITEHKQAETRLQQAKESAEIANQAKSRFLANMSHELRTPLNGILGYIQILNRDKNLTLQQRENIGVIQRCADYLLTLISDVLDLSKIEAERLEPYPTDFYLTDFLKSLVDLFQIRVQQKGIAFHADISCNAEGKWDLPAVVYTDEKRLRQVLINLLSNAVKFTEKGGVILRVHRQLGKIRFLVEDTGIGIAPEELEKIFLPFQQVGKKQYRSEGTGLGLSISKKLVEMMGGKLCVESQIGVGSKFWMDLDLPEVTHSVEYSQPIKEPIIVGYRTVSLAAEKFRILVADDRKDQRLLLMNLLMPLNFEVTEAINGHDAVEKTKTWLPHVVIMDLVMHEMDGFEAIRQIRKLPDCKAVIIIAISASTLDESQLSTQVVECNDFVPKPLQTDKLLQCLQKHLQLEWIYEQTPSPVKVAEVCIADLPELSIKLTQEQSTILLDLAMKGHIKGILDYAEQLEKTSEQLAPFARKTYQLARTFKIKQLREFIKQHSHV